MSLAIKLSTLSEGSVAKWYKHPESSALKDKSKVYSQMNIMNRELASRETNWS
jgi:hypothetical protein